MKDWSGNLGFEVVLGIKCLRSVYKVTSMDRWRSEQVWRSVCVGERVSEGVVQEVLKWFERVERMSAR